MPERTNFYCLVTNHDAAEDSYKLMVRQNYPYKTSGKQDSELSRSKPAMEEFSRTTQADGTVIKVMLDGSTKVPIPLLAKRQFASG